MESKIKEYQDLYVEFEKYYDSIMEVEEPIQEFEKEIRGLRAKQKKVDYNDSNIVIDYMETYVKNVVSEKEEKTKKEVDNEISRITNLNQRVKKNFDKVSKWISIKKAQVILKKANLNLDESISLERAERITGFNTAAILNKVMAFVFRFDFLKFLPKALRIVVACVAWGIILIPHIIKKIYYIFDAKYRDYMFSLPSDKYAQAVKEVMPKLIRTCVISVVLAIVAIILVNIIVFLWTRHMAKKYLVNNQIVYLSIIDPKGLQTKLYDHKMAVFMSGTVDVWQKEIQEIKSCGLAETAEPSSIYYIVKSNLCSKYNTYEEKINDCKAKINKIEDEVSDAKANMLEMVPKLKAKEVEVNSLVGESDHNNGILSPYVSTGFSHTTKEGVKKLVSYKHNCKPMLICYSDETAKDGERFRKNTARLIELFMGGFFQENYHRYINMWLVDFEGLYFPESRTKGLMKVVRTQQALQEMFTELKDTRKLVDSLSDGRISTINPDRLIRKENPIKYNVVYFVENDFTTIDKEINQLFIGGENFGFLPIVFMKQSLAQSMLKDENSSRVFSRVLQKMKDSNQVYEYEGIISELEYDLIVSNQKLLIDEKICANKILSFEEFKDKAYSEEGLDINEVLYVDTFELEEEVYNALTQQNCVQYFTINDNTPDFVSEKVIKL